MLYKAAMATSLLVALLNGSTALASDDVVIEPTAHYPEGLYWDAETNSLFYAEMTRDRVMRLANARLEPFVVEDRCGPTAIGRAGPFMVIACHLGGYLLVTDLDGTPQERIRTDKNGRPVRRPNDVASDGIGIYVSDSGRFAPSAPATGAILYWQPGKGLRRLVRGLRYANGLVVDHARQRLLVSEHLARRILAFPIEVDGRLAQPTVFADLEEVVSLADPLAGPDGLDLGPDGRLYAAIYGAARVMVFDSDGHAVGSFARPERYVTTVTTVGDNPYLFVAGAFEPRTFPFLGQVARVPLASMEPIHR